MKMGRKVKGIQLQEVIQLTFCEIRIKSEVTDMNCIKHDRYARPPSKDIYRQLKYRNDIFSMRRSVDFKKPGNLPQPNCICLIDVIKGLPMKQSQKMKASRKAIETYNPEPLPKRENEKVYVKIETPRVSIKEKNESKEEKPITIKIKKTEASERKTVYVTNENKKNSWKEVQKTVYEQNESDNEVAQNNFNYGNKQMTKLL